MQRNLSLLLTRQQTALMVQRLGHQISRDYRGLHPVLIGVLRGSFIFMADLVRAINIPVTIEFIRAQSYRSTTTSGEVQLSDGPTTPLKGRHVLVVEDIVDTGLTLHRILAELRQHEPASLAVCALMHKPARRRVQVRLDYLGFTIPNKFVVGYGVDLDQDYRHLPDIYTIESPSTGPLRG